MPLTFEVVRMVTISVGHENLQLGSFSLEAFCYLYGLLGGQELEHEEAQRALNCMVSVAEAGKVLSLQSLQTSIPYWAAGIDMLGALHFIDQKLFWLCLHCMPGLSTCGHQYAQSSLFYVNWTSVFLQTQPVAFQNQTTEIFASTFICCNSLHWEETLKMNLLTLQMLTIISRRFLLET